MVAKQSSLTTGEQRKLAQHEEVISKGLHSFVDVGNALLEIQRAKLYTDVDETFEGYCKQKWNISRPRAYQLMDAAKVIEVVSTIGRQTPDNERQARILADLPDEQTQATVWVKAVETAPKGKDGKPKVTAAHVKKVAEQIAPKPPKPAKPEPPAIDVASEPVSVEITTKPAKNGRPTVDIRKFTDLESHLGKAVRMNTEIKTACGGPDFHEAIRTCLNDALKHLSAWKKSVGAA